MNKRKLLYFIIFFSFFLIIIFLIFNNDFSPTPNLSPSSLSEVNKEIAEAGGINYFLMPDDPNNIIHTWASDRNLESQQEHISLVRMPIVANFGWGCDIPESYCIGTYSGGGCVYLNLMGKTETVDLYKINCQKAEPGSEEYQKYCYPNWTVEGYFNGTTREICSENEDNKAQEEFNNYPPSCCRGKKEIIYSFYLTKTEPQLNYNENNSNILEIIEAKNNSN